VKKKKNHLLENTDKQLGFKEMEEHFKSAFRNYVDLISAADRKAALMIQVNSIIVSVIIAFSFGHTDTLSLFLLPTVILLLVALTTISFALHASKPLEKVQKDFGLNNSEIFFFGSFDRVDNRFIKMDWDDYKKKILDFVTGNKAEMMNLIIEESFIVRKVLALKFRYISVAYKVFRYGLIVTIISFLAFYIITS